MPRFLTQKLESSLEEIERYSHLNEMLQGQDMNESSYGYSTCIYSQFDCVLYCLVSNML